MTRQEYALYYLNKGFSIIPIKKNGKTPAIKNWKEFQQRRPSRKEVKAWFSDESDLNIAILTGPISGISVIDADSDEAISFIKKSLPDGPTVRTAKGLHLYCKHTDGVKNKVNIKNINLDIRGEGGYVVAPPSIHESGTQYKWRKGKSLDECELQDFPKELIDQPVADVATISTDIFRGVKKGSRNQSLASISGKFLRAGVPGDICLAFAQDWNNKSETPMEATEVENVVMSIYDRYPSGDSVSNYFVDDAGYLWRNREGKTPLRLANFTATITETIIEDDGLVKLTKHKISGKSTRGKLKSIEVSPASLSSMSFISSWGNKAIIEPGFSIKDHVRYFIQSSSSESNITKCFTHTGWRKINGKHVYLSASGAIGSPNIITKLPSEVKRYSLPLKAKNIKKAIRTSFSFIDIGKSRVTIPLFAMLYLSPLVSLLKPKPNFSGYVYGDTGTFKTTLALILLNHFGQFTHERLSSFDDTANSLQKRAFILKDTLMVLDDYHPSARRADAQHKESIAQNLIRAFANRTARGRLNADTTDKGRYDPRGFLLITAEELISVQSSLARLDVIEIKRGDIYTERLSTIQKKGKLLRHAMASFIEWVGANYERIKKEYPPFLREIRDRFRDEKRHPKLMEQSGALMYAMQVALEWAIEMSAISEKKAQALNEEAELIFKGLRKSQAKLIEKEDPVRLFMDVVHTLLVQRKVRLDEKNRLDAPDYDDRRTLIGYFDDVYIYLLPVGVWEVLQNHLRTEGLHFAVSKRTFYRMLREKGFIETNGGDNLMTVKIGKATTKVLQFIRARVPELAVTAVTNSNFSKFRKNIND